MTASEQERLDRDGCLVLEHFMTAGLLAALRARVEELFAAEGAEAGAEFKQEPQTRRLANLVDNLLAGDLGPQSARLRPSRPWAAFQAQQLERALRQPAL